MGSNIISFCSCGDQIRDVRHKRYLTSIRNLLNRLPLSGRMLSVDISVWTSLDPRGVTCREDSNAQVGKRTLRKSNLVIKGVMNAYL